MKIDLFTFLSKNSADYAEFLKYTCEMFLSGKHKINWKCIESVGCDRIPDGYKLVAKSKDVGQASMNHAEALHLAQNYIESEYVIFIDTDVAILYKNWDQVIVNELDKHDCFGGAFVNRLKKYRNFPAVYLFCFRSNILNKVKLDFRPKLREKNKLKNDSHKLNKEEAYYCNMEPGKYIHCDTGWLLPFIIRKAGLTYSVMDAVPILSEHIQLSFENKQQKKICVQKPKHMSEWHYKGKLFGTHKHASTCDAIDSERGNAWKSRIEVFTKNYKEITL